MLSLIDKIMDELNKPYNPKDHEDKIYKTWEDSGFFNPDNLNTDGEPFTIIMPPPNANAGLDSERETFRMEPERRHHQTEGCRHRTPKRPSRT